MQDMPNSTANNLRVELEDILDADERTNDIEEERRGAEHEAEFYDGDADQDGDSSNPPVRNNVGQGGSSGGGGGEAGDEQEAVATHEKAGGQEQ